MRMVAVDERTADAESDTKDGKESRLERLRLAVERAVEQAAHLLPAQGPIEIFVHHNTLHAFEDRPFHYAVKKGNEVYGAHPYLSESHFRGLLETGRVTIAEVDHVLHEELGEDYGRPWAASKRLGGSGWPCCNIISKRGPKPSCGGLSPKPTRWSASAKKCRFPRVSG